MTRTEPKITPWLDRHVVELPRSVTPDSINVVVDGSIKALTKSHPNFNAVRSCLTEIDTVSSKLPAVSFFSIEYAKKVQKRRLENLLDRLRDLVDLPRFIERASFGRVRVSDTAVLFDGKEVHGVLVERILETLRTGGDLKPYALFLSNLMENPTIDVRDDLYGWLERSAAEGKRGMPLTSDGHFLAFKKVAEDYASIYDRTVMNRIGDTLEMPREDCDDDRNNTCSSGLHFCSFEYLGEYGCGGETRVVMLKINPEDVVAIPPDYNLSKGRACRYTVIGEMAHHEIKDFLREAPPVISSFGEWEDDDNYDDSEEPDWYDDVEVEDDDHDFPPVTPSEEDNAEVATIPPAIKMLRFMTSDKRQFTGAEVLDAVAKNGSINKAAIELGVARSTLQGWVKEINAVY